MTITRIDWQKTALCLAAICAVVLGTLLFFGSTGAAEGALKREAHALEREALQRLHMQPVPVPCPAWGSANELARVHSELERVQAELAEARAQIQKLSRANLEQELRDPPVGSERPQEAQHADQHKAPSSSAKAAAPVPLSEREREEDEQEREEQDRRYQAAHLGSHLLHKHADSRPQEHPRSVPLARSHAHHPESAQHAKTTHAVTHPKAEMFFVEGRELPVLVVEKQHDTEWSKASSGGHRIDKYAEKDDGPPTRQAVHASVAEVLDAMHNFTAQHGLKYWIIDGSLLGALRDGQVIPWDNDADVGMTAADVKQMVNILKSGANFPGHAGIVATRFVYTQRARKCARLSVSCVCC